MELAKKIGYLLSILGIILFFPPISHQLTARFGQPGYLSGPVTFAVGWGLLAAYLAFQSGLVYRQRETLGDDLGN